MSTEIQLPFALASDGTIAVVTDPDNQARQHIESLVGTEPGERVVLNAYGVGLAKYVFDPNDQLVNQQILTEVTDASREWEPNIQINNIIPLPDENYLGIAKVDVHYSRKGSPLSRSSVSSIQTAVIHVGGKVDEIG